MSERSLPGNRCPERLIFGYFSVENQMNPFARSVGIHGISAAAQEVFALAGRIGKLATKVCAVIGNRCEALR
jgi:hypothetical protein